MTILTKISLYRAYSSHGINTPLSRLSTQQKIAERSLNDHTFPYVTMDNVRKIVITNSLLINIVENSAFFNYFYPISTQN